MVILSGGELYRSYPPAFETVDAQKISKRPPPRDSLPIHLTESLLLLPRRFRLAATHLAESFLKRANGIILMVTGSFTIFEGELVSEKQTTGTGRRPNSPGGIRAAQFLVTWLLNGHSSSVKPSQNRFLFKLSRTKAI